VPDKDIVPVLKLIDLRLSMLCIAISTAMPSGKLPLLTISLLMSPAARLASSTGGVHEGEPLPHDNLSATLFMTGSKGVTGLVLLLLRVGTRSRGTRSTMAQRSAAATER
jgi:hypothetical protein